MIAHTIEAKTHGRYLVDRLAVDEKAPMLVGFHGYAETAETMMANLRELGRGSAWCLVSIQALHRFYTRSQEIVASWMTRQDRELEIANNTAYVWATIRAVQRDYAARRPVILVGFSQGVAMAYRAAAAGRCDGLVVLAGDVPPDVAPKAATLPPVLIGRGTEDTWYTEAKAVGDAQLLTAAGTTFAQHVFDGGHVWDPSFVAAARKFVAVLRDAQRQISTSRTRPEGRA